MRPGPIQSLIDAGAPFHEPYGDPQTDWSYNLSFCDIPEMWSNSAANSTGKPQAAAFAQELDEPALRRIAGDPGMAAGYRLLACKRLRDAGASTGAPQVLAVCIDMPQQAGHDLLVCYVDGAVRYLNYSRAGLDSADPNDEVGREGRILTSLATRSLPLIPLTPGARPSPPKSVPGVRISILASDGPHVLDGAEATLLADNRVAAVVLYAGRVVTAAVRKWQAQLAATRH